MKSEKAITPMRCVNANPGKYVSIITNFGCHYTCPECIVRNNGLKMSETDNFSTQEPLNKVLCKERPEWVSVSGGGDPLFHWKDHWSFYEGLFHTAERRNVKLEMHTSYLPDSPEVQDFPLNWFERVVYHVHKFDDLLHVKRKFGEIVRVVFVVDDNMTEQEVATSVAVGYRINQQNAMTIYKSVGKKYEDTLITPRVQETVKAVVAHYDASSLISNRDAVASQMDTKLREVLAEYNIDLQYISVTNFDFTDTFTDAVEAKVKAQQEKEKAETDAEKRRVEAQATADADLIAANAEAEKSKVAADAELYVAEKKAEANRALNDSLNSNLLEYYRITNVDSLWNGELPTYVGGDGSIPIINGIN